MTVDVLIIAVVSLCAAIVTGGLGYGYSSLTVPVALFFRTSRVLNPALVLIEVVVNSYSLWVNRASFKAVLPKTKIIMIGLLPGILVGSQLLSCVNPLIVKLLTYSL